MVAVDSIDSNVTGLRIAEETSLGVLPGSPEWVQYEPNSYGDTGAEISTVARNPINDSRQRSKGVVTDLDSNLAFTTDMTQTNLQSVLQGFMFADFREKGTEIVTAVDIDASNPDEYEVASTTGFQVGDLIQGQNFTNAANNAINAVTAVVADTSVEVADGVLAAEASPPADARIVVIGHEHATATLDVDVSGDLPVYTRASGSLDFTTLGLIPGELIYVGGDNAGERFTNAVNNGIKRVRSVTATTIEVDKSDSALVAETGTGLTVRMFFGRVLKNELGTLINRRSYQGERTLGAPDDAQPTQIQAEYLEGQVPGEFVLNIPTADKLTADLAFVGTNRSGVDGPTALKTGSRPTLVDADAFNTSSDFSRIKLAQVIAGNEAPDPLFAFAQEINITINNNLSPNKAVGTFGSFNITAGTFQVSASLTAYFANIAATNAVINNADVTIDFFLAKSNAGFAVDIPLISLGDGRPNVEQDEPITLPLEIEAARGRKIDATLDHTLMWVFFDYLPTVAQT